MRRQILILAIAQALFQTASMWMARLGRRGGFVAGALLGWER